MCVPAVIGGLAVWRHNNNNKKKVVTIRYAPIPSPRQFVGLGHGQTLVREIMLFIGKPKGRSRMISSWLTGTRHLLSPVIEGYSTPERATAFVTKDPKK